MEQQRDLSRYDRSRYGSNSESRSSAGRRRDSFYDDMLITDEELDRTFGPRVDDQGEQVQQDVVSENAENIEGDVVEGARYSAEDVEGRDVGSVPEDKLVEGRHLSSSGEGVASL